MAVAELADRLAFDQVVAPEQMHQRGPMRPERLLSVRERQSRRLAAHTFRGFDLVAIMGVSVLSLEIGFSESLFDITLARALPFIAGALVLARLIRSFGLYRFSRRESLATHLGLVGLAAGVALTVMMVIGWVTADEPTTIRPMVAWSVTSLIAIGALHGTWSGFVRRWRRQGWLTPNVVVIGATEHGEELIRDAIDRRDMNVIGVFDDRRRGRAAQNVLGVPVLGSTEDLIKHRMVPFIDLIVVAVDPSASARVRDLAARLAVLPNRVTLLFDQDSAAKRTEAIRQLSDAPLAPIDPHRDDDRQAFAKRLQDLIIGVPLLVLVSPVLAAIALAVRLDSPGPAFFRQRRHGFNNEEIIVWKFRSMRQETADARAERQVTKNDDRVTKIGRILRSTSLDELPQLFNVVRGEMSLVGPRPHAVGMKTGDVESAQLVAEYAHRHRIKPGMTGWAAINGSRGPLHGPAEVSRRVALDVDYIDRHSLWFDLKIMVRTLPSMLGDRDSVR